MLFQSAPAEVSCSLFFFPSIFMWDKQFLLGWYDYWMGSGQILSRAYNNKHAVFFYKLRFLKVLDIWKFWLGFHCSPPGQIGFLLYPKKQGHLVWRCRRNCAIISHLRPLGAGYANVCGSLCFIFQRVCQVFCRKTYESILLLHLVFIPKTRTQDIAIPKHASLYRYRVDLDLVSMLWARKTLFWFKQTMENPLPIRQLAAICQRLPHDRSWHFQTRRGEFMGRRWWGWCFTD